MHDSIIRRNKKSMFKILGDERLYVYTCTHTYIHICIHACLHMFIDSMQKTLDRQVNWVREFGQRSVQILGSFQ